MQLLGKPKAFLRSDAQEFINLYASLGERAENFLPNHIIDKLTNFVRLCCEESDDPAKQDNEIDRNLLELKEAIPGYIDVSLMLFPHEDSKAFQYRTKKLEFAKKLTSMIDTEAVDEETKKQAVNILNSHDYSIGTPPVILSHVDYLYKLLLGATVEDLKKFRDVIGVVGDEEEAQWKYFMNVLDQMIVQSTHYTTAAEKKDFLDKSELTVNFKGLNGFIRTVVGGSADTAIKLLGEEVFSIHNVEVLDFQSPDELYDRIENEFTKVFIVKASSMRKNIFNDRKWFPYLSRIVIVDNSSESKSTNTSMVFCFHNGIINTLDKVHTKKLGAQANSQLNLRLILDKVNTENLEKFRECADRKVKDYEEELDMLKMEQLQETDNTDKDLALLKFDDFARQIIKDKFTLTKLRDYLTLILNTKDKKTLEQQNLELIHEFEERTRAYFYSGNEKLHLATIIEGGGRNQIKSYGEYLLQRKLNDVDADISAKCGTILDIIPNNYQRTLHNHFHKNFGINLFLEKYKEYLTKSDNTADNKGRFQNFLIDLGIKEEYDKRGVEAQTIIKQFISDLGNLEKTSISDDVQMIIRDLLFHTNKNPRPYILYNMELSWEYQDLFPPDRFDLNPFDLDIGVDKDGHIDYERLNTRLQRMKNTFQLFDDSGSLWDRFCENLTIVINDPANPSGYTDFNNENLLSFLKFVSTSKITILLDEAYNDAVKTDDDEEPKWRTISRYVFNNISSYANISIVTSLSTTKNLSGTGNRLGAIAATPAKTDVIDYAKSVNDGTKCNTNSVYMLVNIIEAAQLAKKLKDKMEGRLPKNASIFSFRSKIEEAIKFEIDSYKANQKRTDKSKDDIKRYSPFEGSPLHIFLLDELLALDKLEVLDLPDDFMYKGQPFFAFYQKQLTNALNKLRVNKNFRSESMKRLNLVKKVAQEVIENGYEEYAKVVNSDGSYLFNLQLTTFPSFQGLEKFTKELAAQRGIALIPYKTGFVRFSVGGYLDGSAKSYEDFRKELKNSIEIFFKYWKLYIEKRNSNEYKNKTTEDILSEIFAYSSDKRFVEILLDDFYLVKDVNKAKLSSLRISDIMTLYHAFPEHSGVTINSIGDSKNSVFEFYENIGKCKDVRSFIRSNAFTKIYENLLPQIYKNIPAIKHLDFNTVISKYGKPTILKYIHNKLEYQPNSYVLDDRDELNIMKEILIEMENILFSDAKFKIMAFNASDDIASDQQRLEGANMILRKHVKELMLHFNLLFENHGQEASVRELIAVAVERFEEIIGKSVQDMGLKTYVEAFVRDLRNTCSFKDLTISLKNAGKIIVALENRITNCGLPASEQLLYVYLLKREDAFKNAIVRLFGNLDAQLQKTDEGEARFIVEDFIDRAMDEELNNIINQVFAVQSHKITIPQLHGETRKVALMFIDIINRTKSTEYYNKYTHTLSKFVEASFAKQNSSVNEMIQHGITLHKDFTMKDSVLETYNNGELKWIVDVMTKCGVIATEQPVQIHTRIVTDAKKREYPFHKIDRSEEEEIHFRKSQKTLSTREQEAKKNGGSLHVNEYIKEFAIKPHAKFFADRVRKFVANLDEADYRCKIVDKGLIKELVIFQKGYIKYLADNYRLLDYDDLTVEQAQEFVPDVILFLGAPEKVISYPQVGYFDIDGPNGKIKTLVTPLKKEADYFGDVKKPRLTMINEKVKEMGGIPIHGSMFAVEEEDGGIFVVQVDGDSGVGKSEMLAALMLKWLKKDLTRIRSVKLIAGDMFHIFPDTEGNLYGIGTEVGDFSRVTDFDPDYIKYYNSLFESSADSNVEDLNSRSTISGLCDITMPYKIDIMLTASNYAREEAGVIRYDNPENYIYYRNSHGERKEKATSQDNPHLQRTLSRYPGESNIVEVLNQHGNYLDDIFDWELEKATSTYYLCSSYKKIGKIDLEGVVRSIFVGKKTVRDGIEFEVKDIKFDIIRNRFIVLAESEDAIKTDFLLTRTFFSSLYNALASTPAGQPFISEEGQLKGKKHLLQILKGNYGGGKGKKIQLGVLSTDIGKKGREISGPQKAAEELKSLIQEVRIENRDININKQIVRDIVHEKYGYIFTEYRFSPEIQRYNFLLWQLEQMRKADFVRIDNPKVKVDLIKKLKGFKPLPKSHKFSPLLVTPNIGMELSGYSESYQQLLSLPNNSEFADEFLQMAKGVYVAEGYSKETVVNNIVIQLLLMSGYITVEDLNRGRITEKANRETIAAAKSAAIKYLDSYKNEAKVVEKAEEKTEVEKPAPKAESKPRKKKDDK